jgi:2-polyprenyl-3-methyl-5-hydroxy-6-metoxy-1,4-benzoquinol methylase
MQGFYQRSYESELMDEEGIAFDEFHHCLQQLETINHLTLAYRPTLRWLNQWMNSGEPLVILDVGCGGGDMLRQIAKKFSRGNAKNESVLIGVDLNPWAKKSAELDREFPWIHYETTDIFSFAYNRPIDIIIASLFTHHLTDSQIIHFLRWINGRAQRGWFINDLHRHPVPYYFIKAATRLLSRNRLIRNDAAVSVARSFTRADWQTLLDEAEIRSRARISWHFPFRFCVSCEKK